MHVAPTARTHPRRRRALPPAAALPKVAGAAAKAVPLPSAGPVSRAEGEFRVDEARARRDADAALAKIDFSKRDIVLWVPGTDGHEVDPYFLRSREYTSRTGDSISVSVVDYISTWELRDSCPTGIVTLKLVLQGIKDRLGDKIGEHKILLGGLSQGAWVIGEALADKQYGDIVERAVLFGHPWLAAHQYNSGQDPRVRVVNHQGDQVTLPVAGSAADGLDAMAAVRMGRLKTSLPLLVRTIAKNPYHGWLLAKGYSYDWPVFKGIWKDAHNYNNDIVRGYVYLKTGAMVPGVPAGRIAEYPQVYGSLDT